MKKWLVGACDDGAVWAEGKSARIAWETCQRADWMLWALGRIGYDDKKTLRLYACACVRHTPLANGRTVWDLLTDERSRTAIDIAERYANGNASVKELGAAEAAAGSAAEAAAWATWAAEAAARAATWAAEAATWAAEAATWAAVWAADAAAAGAADAAAAGAAGAAGAVARAWQADLLRTMIPWTTITKNDARAILDDLEDWRLEEAMRDERYNEEPDQDHIPCDPAPSDSWRNR